MPRNVLQTLTIVALAAAIFYVAHNFVRYVLRVNGGYSEWTVFTECTKTCGTGTRFRTRTCNNPQPRFGGNNCSVLGEGSQTFKCNMNPCPVDGAYGPWSNFGECSVTCGDGVQQRDRKCDNPAPLFGGLSCDKLELGPNVETRVCSKGMCPVNGGYGPWGDFDDCTVTCGGGLRQRERQCDSPKPEFQGKTCEEQNLGPGVETEACNDQPCPVDGGYSEWTEFGECTVTCGGGVHERTRECTNPAPANGGMNCDGLGLAMESEYCNVEPCPTQPAQDQGKAKKEDDKEKKSDKKEKRDTEGNDQLQKNEKGSKEDDKEGSDQVENEKEDKREQKNAKEKSR